MDVHLELYAGYVKEANAISAALADPRAYAMIANAVHARESLARRRFSQTPLRGDEIQRNPGGHDGGGSRHDRGGPIEH